MFDFVVVLRYILGEKLLYSENALTGGGVGLGTLLRSDFLDMRNLGSGGGISPELLESLLCHFVI